MHAQSAAVTSNLFPVAPVWNLPLSAPLATEPAMRDLTAYLPLDSGVIVSYDLEHGIPLWSVPARTRWQPALGDGLLFVAEASSLTALQSATGAVAWRVPFSEPLAAPLVWDNGWLIAETSEGSILALRGKDGGLIWRRSVAAGLKAQPALAADRVYVPLDDGQVLALRVETGETIWTQRIGGHPAGVLADQERVFVGSDDNYLYSLVASTGEIAWRWPTGADVIGRPVLDNRHVYFVSLDNLARALDRRNGAQRWKRPLPLRPTRGPADAGDAIIVSGLVATIPAFARRDGAPAGEVTAEGELAALPHVVLGQVRPMLILVTHSLSEGTVIRALARSYEPAVTAFVPFPNPTPAVPAGVLPPAETSPAASDPSQTSSPQAPATSTPAPDSSATMPPPAPPPR